EIGTGGQMGTLLGDVEWLTFDESIATDSPAALAHGDGGDALLAYARRARELGGAEVGLALRTGVRGEDTTVSIAVITPIDEHRERRMVFLGGRNGRIRSALAAASSLWSV